ncbi:alpha/beta fold hydrolase [Actinomycetospora aeridis]|uniref:Alpha/beta fold hydrolase n=1 Tax=Actinomycetospora aeridis TaxID=3129231 RepID=A0ABU8MXP9_9PSEU
MTAPTDEHAADTPADTTAGDPIAAQTEAPSPDPAAYLRGYHATAAVRGAAELTKGAGYVLRRALEQSASPGRNTRDAQRWWRHVLTRRRPQWHNDHEIVFETPIARLRDFSGPSPTHPDTDDVVPTLVLPPQAGHDSCIVDFQPRQSQMMVIREAGLTRAFTLDWVGATRATSGTTISDYIAVVDRAVEHCGGHVNLVGDCQGGWLATIYAAIHPEKVNTLTLAGAPIDFHAGETPIGASSRVMTQRFGQLPYRAMVAAGGGNMPGSFVLGGFIAIRPEAEIAKHVDLLRNLDDAGAIARYEAFEDWFKHTQDVPGTFYLWLVEHLFAGNELISGELEVDGKRVDMRNIACPLFLLGGATDHITPPVQVFAAADHVSTPADQVTRRTAPGGHLGLFMGNQALRHEWPPLMAAVAEHSRSTGARRSA